MGPSPWVRGPVVIPNFYVDYNFFGDDVTYPDAQDIMAHHTDKFEHAYWMTAGEKTEMTTEWNKVSNAVYGKMQMGCVTAGSSCGFYCVSAGRYVPSQVTAGRTTNTKDFSTLYNGMRGFFWNYWNNAQPSDQQNFGIAERPTVGGSGHGAITIGLDRNYTNRFRVDVYDGEGNYTRDYLAGIPDCAGDSNAVQWEFVKGSHVIVKMYDQNTGGQKCDDFALPTWPIAETGYYVKKTLTGTGYKDLVPVSPSVLTASSMDYGFGCMFRYAFELRGIRNTWKSLV